ncbi:TylF/MycF/NovP-related O-methyltransferase [Nannocystis bainbridge]|uniref:Macrocin O-methyltransferase n=1 Tax=Nannocystis bainbridge TaxID=2995303 RepID=A0ABT5DYC7_9BACT|nr:TylF/MycF/NovP-related O-methyltransferase [Nannocystis bainbridge]MDC0718581.1 macrocin O-methyltransferase [Nannocystis bainbridge]
MAARFFKGLLTRIGARLSSRTVHKFNAALNYVEVGRWMAARGFDTSRRAAHRFEIYEQIARELGEARVLYLEFGVHRGESIARWSELLQGPGCRLVGFDSFEGLPEDWTAIDRKGTFSTGGAAPALSDPRVSFVKGWFDATLPAFEVPPHERLVLHFDADLYSSTRTALQAFEPHMSVGTYLIFDEFADRNHELRAFEEFWATHPEWGFRLVGCDSILARVAFERVR